MMTRTSTIIKFNIKLKKCIRYSLFLLLINNLFLINGFDNELHNLFKFNNIDNDKIEEYILIIKSSYCNEKKQELEKNLIIPCEYYKKIIDNYNYINKNIDDNNNNNDNDDYQQQNDKTIFSLILYNLNFIKYFFSFKLNFFLLLILILNEKFDFGKLK